MKKMKRDIGKLDSCIIVIDYNPSINDNVDIRCFKDRNEARKYGYTNPIYLDKHSITLKDLIRAIKNGETYIY